MGKVFGLIYIVGCTIYAFRLCWDSSGDAAEFATALVIIILWPIMAVTELIGWLWKLLNYKGGDAK